jgi:hypothetical protein
VRSRGNGVASKYFTFGRPDLNWGLVTGNWDLLRPQPPDVICYLRHVADEVTRLTDEAVHTSQIPAVDLPASPRFAGHRCPPVGISCSNTSHPSFDVHARCRQSNLERHLPRVRRMEQCGEISANLQDPERSNSSWNNPGIDAGIERGEIAPVLDRESEKEMARQVFGSW